MAGLVGSVRLTSTSFAAAPQRHVDAGSPMVSRGVEIGAEGLLRHRDPTARSAGRRSRSPASRRRRAASVSNTEETTSRCRPVTPRCSTHTSRWAGSSSPTVGGRVMSAGVVAHHSPAVTVAPYGVDHAVGRGRVDQVGRHERHPAVEGDVLSNFDVAQDRIAAPDLRGVHQAHDVVAGTGVHRGHESAARYGDDAGGDARGDVLAEHPVLAGRRHVAPIGQDGARRVVGIRSRRTSPRRPSGVETVHLPALGVG